MNEPVPSALFKRCPVAILLNPPLRLCWVVKIVKASPFAGVKPLINVILSVPSSVAVPVTTSWSYSVAGVCRRSACSVPRCFPERSCR